MWRRSVVGTLAVGLLGMERKGMEIRLEQKGMLGIRAVLRNGSGQPVVVLHSVDLQPSRIVLLDARGKQWPAFDERSRMKFDRTVRAAMFRRITVGGELELGDERFRALENGTYELNWGPFRYAAIPAGEWKVSVVFEATIDRPTEKGHLEPGWTGKLESKQIVVALR